MIKNLVVTKWLTEKESDDYSQSCGSLGGWVKGESWDQYLVRLPVKEHVYLEALRKRILDDQLKIGGDEHQYGGYTPLFSDMTIGVFSFRAWGDLIAAIYNTHENTNQYGYMDFYMSCLIKEKKA